jgi:hypothetical protein
VRKGGRRQSETGAGGFASRARREECRTALWYNHVRASCARVRMTCPNEDLGRYNYLFTLWVQLPMPLGTSYF